jgi:hypothetical protein
MAAVALWSRSSQALLAHLGNENRRNSFRAGERTGEGVAWRGCGNSRSRGRGSRKGRGREQAGDSEREITK